MRQHLSAHHIANEIRLRKTPWDHAFVVVEGATDARFYKRFVFKDAGGGYGVVPAHGRERLLGCLELLGRDPAWRERVVGIADRDFWVLGEGRPPELDGLMLTDGRDMEIMVLRSPALGRLLDGYGSEEKLKELHQAGRTVEQVLLDAGVEIGLFRWLNERAQRVSDGEGESEVEAPTRDGSRLCLDFNDLDFARFIDRKMLVVNRDTLATVLANRSRQALRQDAVTNELEVLREHARRRGHDRWDLCCGHDLVMPLKLGLRSLLGSCDAKEVERLERVLLLGIYKEEEFAQTGLWAALTAWQEAHPDARLLPGTLAPYP